MGNHQTGPSQALQSPAYKGILGTVRALKSDERGVPLLYIRCLSQGDNLYLLAVQHSDSYPPDVTMIQLFGNTVLVVYCLYPPPSPECDKLAQHMGQRFIGHSCIRVRQINDYSLACGIHLPEKFKLDSGRYTYT